MKKNLAVFMQFFEMKDVIEWCGFRFLIFNDIFYLGFDKCYKNLIYVIGLGWFGIIFGLVIGKIIVDLS